MTINNKNTEKNNKITTLISVILKNLKIIDIKITLNDKKHLTTSPNFNHFFGINEIAFKKSTSKSDISTAIEEKFTSELPNNVKFYANIPLISSKNDKLGSLTLFDTKIRHLSTKELLFLEEMTKIIIDIIEEQAESQKLLEVFTDVIHKTVHDLKNPSTSIALTAELLKRKIDDQQITLNCAERIENANNKTLALLDHLRTTFLMENEDFKINIQEVDSNRLSMDIRHHFSQITFHANDKSPVVFHSDYTRLKEAIIGLIQHLLYSTEQTTEVTLAYALGNGQVIISLSCPLSHLNQEILNREKNTLLAISKALIEINKGQISAASDENQNRFYFHISLPN